MEYDSLIIGPVSLDINIDCEGNTRRELGGAVVASGYAAAGCGFHTAVLTKANPAEADAKVRFEGSGADVYVLPSAHTCSIQNQYLTPDKDRRICASLGVCDPFTVADLQALLDVHAQIYHFGGLVCGDIEEALIPAAAQLGRTAVDMQGFLRYVTPDHCMEFHDWANKQIYLPYIDYLKADAAEAEILTGTDDRHEAARMLAGWGAREIMITNSDEVLIYDGEQFYACPIRSRNLSGRTGRGDTVFAGYINLRAKHDLPESLYLATALVSLKMETPGPFCGTMADVEAYRHAFYADAPIRITIAQRV